MTAGDRPDPAYRLVVSRPAARALAETLPASVAAAAVEFITGDLLRTPRRVGKELRGDLTGIWSARRGSYRVLYLVADPPEHAPGNTLGVVTVTVVEHRRDVYRRR